MKNIKKHKILAINDNLDQLELLTFILSQAGYRVVTAMSGNEGFEVAARELPDLIISDVMMSDGDGIELCRMIRGDVRLCLLPILLLSALRKDTDSVLLGLEAGADDYIEVPYVAETLVAKATRLIERKLAADALRESEENYQILAETASDAIIKIDSDSRILFINRAGEKIFGYPVEEMIGQPLTMLMSESMRAAHRAGIRRYLETGKQTISWDSMEVAALHRDGHEFPIELSFGEHQEGKHFFIGIARDITGRKQAENALRESEERFKAQYKGNPIPTYTLKKDRDDFVFVDYNDAAEKVTQNKIAALVGSTAGELYADEPEVLENIHRCFDQKTTVHQETLYRLRTASEVKHLDVTYVFVPPDMVMAHMRDITEQYQAEIALRFQKTLLESQSEASIDGILVVSPYGEVISHNRRFLEIWEIPEKVLATRSGEAFLKSMLDKLADAQEFLETVSYFYKHSDETGRVEILLKDGRILERYTAPVIDANNTYHGRVWFFRDNTERRRAEQQLDHFFTVSVDLLCFVGFDGYFKRLNPAWEKVLGYSEEELLAKPFIEFIHPDDRERTVEEFEQNFVGQKTISFENRYLCRDGSYKWLLWNSATVKDEQMIYAVAHDITERKQTENALRESQEHLSIAQEVARIGSFELDLQTNQAKFSPALEALYGAPSGGLNQKYEDWTKYVHPEDLPKALREMEQVLANGEFDSEFRILQKDESIRWLYGKGKVFYDDEGAALRLVGVNMDVTERKQAEVAVAEANDRAIREYVRLLEKLATLGQKLGTARDLTAVFGAILEFALASVPCSALFISLYDKEQSIRKGVYMWYNGNEMEVSQLEPVVVGNGPVGQAIKSGEVIIVDDYQNALGKKPTHIYLGYEEDSREPSSMIVAPMKIMGSVVGTIEIQSYDLAAYTGEHATALRMAANLAANTIENVRLLEQERKSAEQLRQAQKLESVGRLAGGIAHDFNNMLTAINGYSDLILRQLSHDSPIRSKIEEIKKAGERSAALTHQLLAFSRRQMLKTKVLDINEVIIETSKMLQRLIGEDVQLNIQPGSKIGQIEADPGQLTQVVMNLAVNARDSMPDGGELTIETANIYLDEEYAARHVPTRAGSYVMLAVSDTGTGLDEETQQHIFEPFFTTKEVGKGTGLGLATVYGIVKQSGGYIWVDSIVGDGTTFKIYLPRIDDKVELSIDQSAPEYVEKGNETILLVEDEELLRNLCRQILESCGYKVIEAANGGEALSICRQAENKIDLMLTDVVMPKMSGRQLGEQLAVLRPEIKVLYMSGYTDDKTVRQDAVEEGANFIQKPFTFDTLAEKVRVLLDAKN